MSGQMIAERGSLEKKDKSELQAIVEALGGSVSSRARKAELIDQIIELSQQATDPAPSDPAPTDPAPTDPAPINDDEASDSAPAANTTDPDPDPAPAPAPGPAPVEHPVGPDGEPLADWEVALAEGEGKTTGARQGQRGRAQKGTKEGQGAGQGRSPRGNGSSGAEVEAANKTEASQPEPAKAKTRARAERTDKPSTAKNGAGNRSAADRKGQDRAQDKGQDRGQDKNANKNSTDKSDDDETDPNNRRSRRRGRGRGRDRDDAGNDPVTTEPVPVSGTLDLREEGYGFVRVNGHLQSKDDVYVSVKQVRQYGLRKGDQIAGSARPANRNEKNPGFHQIDTVNGGPPEQARNRPRFDDLTPLFPDQRLTMEMKEEPFNMTTRIVDLVSPIGKGQRGLIVSPPKAGKTTVMKDIARAIETNNPEVNLIVLLVDERPEEVTDMRRSLTNGQVAASTFDRPPEEHCAVAELTIEQAKRLVESGQDVVLIVDGITRLARAYNLVAPQTGRAMSGGVDAGALYPPKRFFGAARNLEEGGSLTILATALIDTGSRMDEVIFEEFKGTGNMELRLDRRLAEKRIFPAIDVDGSSTRHEELLFDAKELKLAWKLRRVLSAMGDEGSSAAGVEMLIDRLGTFKNNSDFLAEMAKTPSN